jgi:RHS repeat-associated protein
VPDGLGSIIGLSDATGALTAWTKYDPWGTVLASSGTIPQYGYTGREPDGTGLVYYRARYYDPRSGRFTQRDPIGLRGGLNPYAYVGNNPVNFTDPGGTRLEAVQLPGSNGRTQTFYFDSSIASNVVSFVSQVRAAGYPITINLGFRTTDEQRALFENSASNSNPVAKPGTSLHEAGFALDINGASLRSVDAAGRAAIEGLALSNGLTPIDTPRNSGFIPGRVGGEEGTWSNPRIYDPPHFQASPVNNGYASREDAIVENQGDYKLIQAQESLNRAIASNYVSSESPGPGDQSLQNPLLGSGTGGGANVCKKCQ